jgi:hypothetical protein
MAWALADELKHCRTWVDTENPRRFKVETGARRFGQSKAELRGDGQFRIYNPCGDIELDRSGKRLKLEGATLQVYLEIWVAGRWERHMTGPVDGEVDSRKILLPGVHIITNPLTNKWEITAAPGIAGRFRLVVRGDVEDRGAPRVVRTPQWSSYPGRMVLLRYPDFRAQWGDMAGEVESVVYGDRGFTLFSDPFDLALGEVRVFDPTFGPEDADYNADYDSSQKFENADPFQVGVISGFTVRCCARFDITSLPASGTVTQVDCTFYAQGIGDGSGAQTFDLGPYNGDGQADPDPDSASTSFSRSDVSSDKYVSATVIDSTGSKSYTDLGSQANSDMEAARDAGTIFTLAWKNVAEAQWDYVDWDAYNQANAPTLTVTYTTGGATPTMVPMSLRDPNPLNPLGGIH